MPLFANSLLPHLVDVGVLHRHVGDPYVRTLHNHPDWIEILFLTQGGGTYVISGKCYSVRAPAVVIYNQGEWHEEQTDSQVQNEVLFLGCTHVSPAELAPANVPILHVGEQMATFEKWFRLMLMDKQKPVTRASEKIADHVLTILLTELAAFAAPDILCAHTRAARTVANIQRCIHENYACPLTLTDIAQKTFLTSSHLSHVFKKATGVSPIQYLISYRLEVAKQYLTTTDKTIEDIALHVGYESTPHFHSVFKKCVGLSPGLYRELESRKAENHPGARIQQPGGEHP